METVPTNPLSKFFRKPAIYLRLPSGGQYWPEGSIDLPESGEIPVYPMTAADEISLKTPDALLNGQGVVDVVRSCCPNILDPWKMPSIDVDTILISMRIATYGNSMEFGSDCPKCGEANSYDLPLAEILASVGKPDYHTPLVIDGLQILLRPPSYKAINRTNMINFEEERIVQTINDDGIDDETRKTEFEKHLKRLVELNLQIVVDSTDSITTPDGTEVKNSAMITEFYQNSSGKVLKLVQDRLKECSDAALLQPQKVQCTGCKSEYLVPVMFDYSNFFG